MTCDQARELHLAERYARGELPRREAAAFEEHYWGCATCLDEIEAIQTAKFVLSASAHARPKAWPWKWAAAAALLTTLGGGAFWALREGVAPELAQAPVRRQQPAGSVYAALARFEMPTYQPLRMRSSSPVQAALQSAMGPYMEGRPGDSIAGLRAVVGQYPGFAPARFYLAASLLQAGDTAGASREFKRLIAMGDSVFLEDSLFLLAQAELLTSQPGEARTHLKSAVALGGARRTAALQLLERLDQIDKPAVH
ncbi:MAG: zf-HC2 domain-containing protein [Candidatus Solibacter usitatus]|nr:zf-HC2 domain-containing protein [Candidatus Solibacter usitatus]